MADHVANFSLLLTATKRLIDGSAALPKRHFFLAVRPNEKHLFFVTPGQGCPEVRFRPAFLRDKPCRIGYVYGNPDSRFSVMLIGYMRVSSSDDRQVVDLQLDALLAAGVDERHLHQDKQSGGRDDRAGLKTCLAGLRAGDVLVVWKLDRLGR